MRSRADSYPASATATLLLSGGRSERFGGRPKALLKVRGEPAVRQMAAIALHGGLSPVVLVVRPDALDVIEAVAGLPVVVRPSERCALGRSASINEGLGAIPSGLDVLLWPVDHPFAHAKTLRALTDAKQRDPMVAWLIPTFEGRDGHPVLIAHNVRSSVQALAPGDPLRIVRDRFLDRVVRVPVDDPGVVEAIDTPDAYSAASSREEQWIGD